MDTPPSPTSLCHGCRHLTPVLGCALRAPAFWRHQRGEAVSACSYYAPRAPREKRPISEG